MFETDAEELFRKKPLGYEMKPELEIYKDGFKDGYNKANEWHKPSEKLPEECSLVLAYDIADKEPSLYYFVASDQWEWLPRRIVFLSNGQIKRWKEIVPPKETE